MSLNTIGILLFEHVEEMDFVGPYEVFTVASAMWVEEGGEPLNEVVLISETGGDVLCSKGLRVKADCSIEDAPPLDVLLVPGGRGSRAELKNDVLLDWIRKTAADCQWVTSVCTGSLILAAAGLTEGKRMTTHWAAFDEFHELGLKGELQRDVRYVRDGNLLTAAGISAGIDMALWLTGQMHGVPAARIAIKEMQYDPAPPYAADV